MTTLLMLVCVVAVVVGGLILGWLARAQQFGSCDYADLISKGEVGDP